MANIVKMDDEQRMVFGWATVTHDEAGTQLIDSQGDLIDVPDMERAAYGFVLDFREANTMHSGPVTGRLVESFVSTPEKIAKMGIPPGTIPSGWFVGFKVDDDAAWEGIKSGRYSAFSIEGKGKREAI